MFLKLRYLGCVWHKCVCVFDSGPASGDDVQSLSAHTCTYSPHCKLCYRQNLSPASPRPCSHVLQIIPPFLVNTMHLSQSNQPTQISQSGLLPVCGCQTLVFPVKDVIAILWGNKNCCFVQISIEYREERISSDNYRVLQQSSKVLFQYLHYACFFFSFLLPS